MQGGRSVFGSHQYAAMAHGVLGGARAAQALHHSHPCQHQIQQHQQWQLGEQQGQWREEGTDLLPLPRWAAVPLHTLAELARQHAPFLEAGPPPAASDDCMVVRLHLDQARTPRGQRQPSRKDLYTLLFRVGVQRPNSTMHWAAIQQHDACLSTLRITVRDSEDARQAAREVVAAGALAVEGYTIPATWDRMAAPPAGCTEVTLHQLPVEFVRQGVGAVLLAAAQQDGAVVAEFLGGSRITGDASLSCPAADTVVLWVQAPQDDPLLTRLPASFPVPGRPDAKIEVAGRPSLAPQRWPALTACYIRAREAAAQVVRAQQGRGQQQVHHGEQQQQRGQRRREQQPQPQPETQPQQSVLRQQPRGQHGPVPDHDMTDALPDNLDVCMEPADPGPGAMLRGGSEVQLPGHQLPADSTHMGVWRETFMTQLTEVLEESDDPIVRYMPAAAKDQLWERSTAHFAADLRQCCHPAQRVIRSWIRETLAIPEGSYGSADESSSDEAGSDSGGSAAARPRRRRHDRPQPHQHRQQHQQQQPNQQVDQLQDSQQQPPHQQQPQSPQAHPRRSSRASRGHVSADYLAVHGPSMGHNEAAGGRARSRGKRGKGGTKQPRQPQPHQNAPLTPATPASRQPRRGGRGK